MPSAKIRMTRQHFAHRPIGLPAASRFSTRCRCPDFIVWPPSAVILKRLTKVLECETEPAGDILLDPRQHANATGIGQAFDHLRLYAAWSATGCRAPKAASCTRGIGSYGGSDPQYRG